MSIIIEPPVGGLSQSAHVGFESLRNLDIDSIAGVVQLNNRMFAEQTTLTTIEWFEANPKDPNEIFAIGKNKHYYTSDGGNNWETIPAFGTTAFYGAKIFADYLFLASATGLHTYGPLSYKALTSLSDASPIVGTLVAHGFADGDRIKLATTGDLPSPLDTTVTYFIVNKAADTFQLSLTSGGAAINWDTVTAGSGTHSFILYDVAWQTIDSDGANAATTWHPMLSSTIKNGIYGGAGRYIFSVDELTTFDPFDAATFLFTKQTLILPAEFRVKCLEELGNNLMIGTWQGGVNDLANIIPKADIFPWNQTSTTWNQPIRTTDYGVHALINTGTYLIALIGVEGSIYRCDGAAVYKIAEVPLDLKLANSYVEFYPGALCKHREKVFFGIGTGGILKNTSTQVLVPGMGTYSLVETNEGAILNLEHTNALFTDGSLLPLAVTALLPSRNDVLIQGYQDDSSKDGTAKPKIEKLVSASFAYTTDYVGYFDSPLYQVGNSQNKFKPNNLTVFLGKPLLTGEGIRIQYRTSLAGTFATVKDITYANHGGVQSYTVTTELPNNIKECEQLQLRVALKGTATTTPQFKQLVLE